MATTAESSRTVSVLIPCHNAERWLGVAIASALDCTGVSEVVIVDDGSTDGSREVARGFGDRVRLIEQTRSGGNVARNRLLQAARGTWLQFLDADDYLESHKIATQFAEAGNLDDCDVLYSPVWVETWRNGRAEGRSPSELDISTDLFTQWFTWQLPQTGGVLWHAHALRAIGGWNPTMPCCQEHELYLRALQAGLRWKFCRSPGAVYRIWSEDTVCRRDPVRVIRERTKLLDSALSWLEQHDRSRPVHRHAAAQAFFEMARTWARSDVEAAAEYYRTQRARGLVKPRGPAAPFGYRLALATLGFSRAERLAVRLRRQTRASR